MRHFHGVHFAVPRFGKMAGVDRKIDKPFIGFYQK